MATEFRVVMFRVATNTDTSGLFDHVGYAFELPDWPEFRAVAHEVDSGWGCTHWESGYKALSRVYETREEIPGALDRKLKHIGRDSVLRVLEMWVPK